MFSRTIARFQSVSMPRVVIGALSFLVLVAFMIRAAGWVDRDVFRPLAMLVTLVVLLLASWVSSWVLGKIFDSAPSTESAVISGLILWFLVWPQLGLAKLLGHVGLAVLVQVSKYLFAWRGRHVFNPVAAGLVLGWLLNTIAAREVFPPSMWWVANEFMLWPVFFTGVVVVWRTGRAWAPWVFLLVGGTWYVMAIHSVNLRFFGPAAGTWPETVTFVLAQTPLVFLAVFMLTEPLTLPPGRLGQIVAAVVAAVVFTLPIVATDMGFVAPRVFAEIPGELALLASGLVALAFGQRGTHVRLVEKRSLGRDLVEYRFLADHPIKFTPGQYVELDLPHERPDGRGRRRPFSPIRVEGREIVLATRHPEAASTYKWALKKLEVGATARVTAVHGDFVLPKSGPVLLIGSGIGVTPFLSQLAADPNRDVVLVVGVRDGHQPYRQELVELAPRSVVVPIEELTPQFIRDEVPDFRKRTILVSGRPDFVRDLSLGLATTFSKPRTDHFWGV